MVSKPNIDASLYRIDPTMMNSKKSYSGNDKEPSLAQIEQEFDNFEHIDFNNSVHRKEILSMFPEYLITESAKADIDLFLAMSRYDRKHQTFIAGCFENQSLNFLLLSYKWRLRDDAKWKTRYGTHPNSTPFVRIATDDKSIYFIEGHKDSLTATLLGIDFVMLPNAGYKNKESLLLLESVTSRNIIFLVEDKAAYKCMTELADVLSQTAKSIVLKELDRQSGVKIDLSDYVQNFNTIGEVINGLQG